MTSSIPPDIVDALLRIEGASFVRQVDWFEELGSTNDQALRLADDPNVTLPRLVWTGRQTAGRGRGANAWWSGPGSLTFSLVIDTETHGLPPDRRPQLSLLTGLAVLDALRPFVPESALGLKWPNDVWLSGRKVCGILVETASRLPQRVVIGVGLNVGNSFRSAPPELRQIATSLVDETPSPVSPPAILLSFLSAWPALVRHFVEGELDLPRRWSRHCVLTGRPIRLTAGTSVVEGRCAGIDLDGALLIDTPGRRERHIAGTVRLVEAHR
jgi:BirA family transcriptional regulator, biotin operon repressor / biotin---[acetyl-CoA-carboxylase] ligase